MIESFFMGVGAGCAFYVLYAIHRQCEKTAKIQKQLDDQDSALADIFRELDDADCGFGRDKESDDVIDNMIDDMTDGEEWKRK